MPEIGCFSVAGLLRESPLVFNVNISSAIFDCSAPDLDSCPDESLPEFAFIGRSNAGKSSLLNMLSGKRDLARVSPTPGFTKLINIFTMNKTWRLVDLPGYGFAHIAREHSARFNKAVSHYLKNRPNLCCVFALIDSGLTPQTIDLEFVEWLAGNSIPFVLVFTKTDKVTAEKVASNIKAFKDQISGWFEKMPLIFTCSSVKNQGRAELLAVVSEALAGMQVEKEQSSQDTKADPEGAEQSQATNQKAGEGGRKRKLNPHRPW